MSIAFHCYILLSQEVSAKSPNEEQQKHAEQTCTLCLKKSLIVFAHALLRWSTPLGYGKASWHVWTTASGEAYRGRGAVKLAMFSKYTVLDSIGWVYHWVEFIINILTEHANSIVRQLCQLVFIGLSWHHGCRDDLNLLTVLSASHIWSVMVLYHTYSNCLFEGGLWMIMSLFWFGFVLSNYDASFFVGFPFLHS